MLFILIGLTAIISYSALNNRDIFEKLLFNTHDIIERKQYFRIFTSGFLHGDFNHLLLNMITLYFFGDAMLKTLGGVQFLMIYFLSMLGGGIISLLMNKDNPNYRAVGASGAVSGIIYSFVMFYPTANIYLYFAIPVPGFIFGILYIVYSMYSMRAQSDNIGHEAHLGGAITGGLLTMLLYADRITDKTLPLIVLGASLIALFVIIKRPDLLKK